MPSQDNHRGFYCPRVITEARDMEYDGCQQEAKAKPSYLVRGLKPSLPARGCNQSVV
jgi:hypothetical protein